MSERILWKKKREEGEEVWRWDDMRDGWKLR